MKISICAGGTGGHMFPASALFWAMQSKGHDVTLITDTRGEQFCQNISRKVILDTVRFSKINLVSNLFCLSKLFLKFIKMWKAESPDIVVGFGGSFTLAPLISAKMFGAKVVICEQNIVVGKANSLLSHVANLKLSAFNIDHTWKQIAMPVRQEFSMFSKEYNCNDKIKILVIGGSQGANSFGQIIPDALLKLDDESRKDIEIIQQVGHGNALEIKQKYDNIGVKSTLLQFVDNVAEVMADCQLVICRSGASTLSELVEMGRPAVLIPYPLATNDHQYRNAMYYGNKNAAWVIKEDENSAARLALVLNDVIRDRIKLKDVAKNIKSTKINCTVDDVIKIIENTLEK